MNRTILAIVIAVLVGMVALAQYRGAIDNEFIWDDPIVFNRQLPYFDSLSNVFMPPRGIPQFAGRYYRPLIVVTYQIDEWIAETFWDESERESARQVTYHASVVVYNAIATVLVFLLGLTLHAAARAGENMRLASAGIAGSTCAAVLFAVHPIHVESVAWMAGRSDVICGIFFVAATIFYLLARMKRSPVYLGLFAVCALASMLSKETGVGLLLLMPALEILLPPRETQPEELSRAQRRQKKRDRRLKARHSDEVGPRIARLVALAAAAFVYFIFRGQALQSMGAARGGFSFTDDLLATMGNLLSALGWFVVKGVWPPPQSAFVGKLPGGIVPLVGFVSVAAALAAWWYFKNHAASRELSAAAIFFAASAPSLAIAVFRISESPLAERYLYIPTVGLCLLAGYLLERLVTQFGALSETIKVATVAALTLAVALPAMSATRTRAEVWKDDFTFWKETVKAAPDEGIPHLHLGMEYSRMGQYDQALESYQLAYENYAPDDLESRSKALNNMSTVHLGRGELDRAIALCQQALKIMPSYPTPYFNMASAHRTKARQARTRAEQMQQFDLAKRYYQEAIKRNPRYTKAYLQYGTLLIQLGETELGKKNLQRAMQLAPASPEGKRARQVLEGLG